MRHLPLLALGLCLLAACLSQPAAHLSPAAARLSPAADSLSQPADSLIAAARADLRAGMNQGDLDLMVAARAAFERASADTERAAWARYYAALADFRIANHLLTREEASKDRASAHLESAVESLKEVLRLDPESAEAWALLNSVYGRQIALSPMKGMLLGRRSKRALERAKELAPDNPRVVLTAAVSDFNTPGMWGGDKERAMEGFRRAAALFAVEEPADPLQPVWGHDEVYAWIGLAHLDRDERDQARAAFEKALEIEPDFGWVRYALLPGLDEAAAE